MFCAAVRLEIELAKEEESLSHTLHNVPVVSKKHLFPQEISLSIGRSSAVTSSTPNLKAATESRAWSRRDWETKTTSYFN